MAGEDAFEHEPGSSLVQCLADWSCVCWSVYLEQAAVDLAQNLVSADDRDGFIAKLDSNGNYVWAIDIGGERIVPGPPVEGTPGFKDQEALEIGVDGADNVYAVGYFESITDFDPDFAREFLLEATTTTAGITTRDIFVAKYSPAGELIWVAPLGSEGDDIGYGLALDTQGNVLVVGHFDGTIDFDPAESTTVTKTAESQDGFVLKLATDGSYQWSNHFKGSSTGRGIDVASDAQNNVYTTGYFRGKTNFTPSETTIPHGSSREIFVTKHLADGTLSWVYHAGGNDSDVGHGVAVVGDALYVTGAFAGTVDFHPDAVSASDILTAAGGADVFVLKLSATDGAFQWVRQIGGADEEQARSIAASSAGRVYATGFFNGQVDFDPSSSEAIFTASGGQNAFVSELSTAGDFLDVSILGAGAATNGYDLGYDLTVDLTGEVVVTGDFIGIGDFDPDLTATQFLSSTVVTDAVAKSDIYIVKLGVQDQALTAIPATVNTEEDQAAMISLRGSGAGGASLNFSIVSQPTHGILGDLSKTGAATAQVLYAPNANFNGRDSFDFQVDNGSGETAIATANITVVAVNDLPIAQAQSVNTAEDTAVVITLSAIDADGDALTFSFTDPEHGPLRPVAPDLRLNQQRPLHASPDGSVELNVEYTPSTNYNGSDGFSFAVDDGTEMSESVAVSITVEPRNDPPSAISGLLITIKDTPVTVSLQGSDVDGDALVFSISQQPTNGTLGEIQPEDNTLAKVDYRPNAGFIGDDSIAFEVDDGNNGKQVGTIKITVKETNQPPEPNSQVVSVAVDTAEVIVLTGTDVDEDPLTFIVTRKPTNGSLSEPQLKNNSSAEVVYTPNSGFVGEDGFEFKVSDGLATSDVTVVTLEIGDNNLRESTIYLPLITLGN